MYIIVACILWIAIGVLVMWLSYTRYGGGETMAMMAYTHPALVVVLLIGSVIFWPISIVVKIIMKSRQHR